MTPLLGVLVIALQTAGAPLPAAANPEPRPAPDRNDDSESADAVVPRVVLQLDQSQRLEQRRQVHAKSAAVALPRAVPATDRVVRRAPEGRREIRYSA